MRHTNEEPNRDDEVTKNTKEHERRILIWAYQSSLMKTLTAAGFLAIAVAVWLARPATSAVVPQAPLANLPPADYSLGPDSQPQPGVPKGTPHYCNGNHIANSN